MQSLFRSLNFQRPDNKALSNIFKKMTNSSYHLMFVGSLVLFSPFLESTALTTGLNVRRRLENREAASPRELQAIAPVIVGDNGSPESVFPLQRCQGDW